MSNAHSYGPGFGEAPFTPSSYFPIQVGPDGRVLIPVDIRRAMMIGEDRRLTGELVDGELRLISPAMALKKLQDMIQAADTGTGSIVDELIADRRAEAARE